MGGAIRQILGDLEGHLQALLVIQARIDEGLVAVAQRLFVDAFGPADHLGHVVTRQLHVQAAGNRARGLVSLEEATNLVHDRLKAARLVAGRRRDRVAMHRIRHPRDRTAILARGLKQRRQRLADAPRTHARDERQAPILTIRVQPVDEREHLVARRGRSKLDPNRITHAREQLDVSALLLARALPRPQEVSGRIVGLARARIDASHRGLILQEQGLVRRKQVHVAQRLEVDAGGTHELDRAVDVFGQRLVARVGRVRHETLVPAVHLTQIRVAALREGTDQVQRRGRMVVQGQEPLRVGLTRLGRELEGVDGVTAIARQRHAVSRLHGGRARLGVLTGDAPDLNDRQRRAVGEHDGHLQQRLDLQTHVVGRRLSERLRAVAPHEDERLAARRRTHPRA